MLELVSESQLFVDAGKELIMMRNVKFVSNLNAINDQYQPGISAVSYHFISPHGLVITTQAGEVHITGTENIWQVLSIVVTRLGAGLRDCLAPRGHMTQVQPIRSQHCQPLSQSEAVSTTYEGSQSKDDCVNRNLKAIALIRTNETVWRRNTMEEGAQPSLHK